MTTGSQYPRLGNPVDRGAWRAAVHEVAKSQINLLHSPLLPIRTAFSCDLSPWPLRECHLPWGCGSARSFPSMEGPPQHLPDGGRLALDAWRTPGTSPLHLLLPGCSS